MPKFRDKIKDNKLFAKVFITLPKVSITNEMFLSGNYSFVALIDTGASHSAITKKVVEKLGLLPYSKTTVNTATKTEEVNTYQVSVFIPIEESQDILQGDSEIQIVRNVHIQHYPLKVSELRSSPHEFDVIIGMDIIKQGILIVNGDSFTFAC